MSGIIKLWRNERGAVSPTVALSLVGLIASGGLAFDYAQLAALDTELQQAADQAALAAATQLDGATGACSRAAAAASSLLVNQTRFANDGSSAAITVTSESTCDGSGAVQFYQSYDEVTDIPGSPATSDANAKVVIIQVGARRARYALTPIVGVFQSPNISAQAVASLSSAICKIPPLMFCAPNADFPQASDLGKGILLEPGGGGAWTAGNYGYLDFGNGASGVKINLGKNNEVAVCSDHDEGTPTEPGNQASVTKFLNTRFDLYEPSVTACNSSTGDFCPAEDVMKDLSRTEVVKIDAGSTPPANPGCGDPTATVSDFAYDGTAVAFTRDSNQASCLTSDNSCPKFGNKDWDEAAYVAANHPSTTASAIATAMGKTVATLMRYDVYQWEKSDKPNRLPSKLLNPSDPPDIKQKGNSGNYTYTFTNRCSYPQPKNGTAVVAGTNQKDRRLLTVAVVDCTGANGKFDAKVLRFADLFLVQPSIDRGSFTGKDQIYAEIVRIAERANGQSAFQYYLRQRPRLLK